MTAPDVAALAAALEGQNLWHGRHATSPAGTATAHAIIAALAAQGWRITFASKCGCSCNCHHGEQEPEQWPGPCAACCEPGDNCDCGRALWRITSAPEPAEVPESEQGSAVATADDPARAQGAPDKAWEALEAELPVSYADFKAAALGRPCASCGHERVHHFGATDGKAPPSDERRCWVYERQKRPPHECRCTGWVADLP